MPLLESILRYPDVVMIEKTPARMIAPGKYVLRDLCVCTTLQESLMHVTVTAEESTVSKIRLRWHTSSRLSGQVLGDAWERGYADLAWDTLTPYRTLPWYCLVHSTEGTVGYGVRVRPGAICSWQLDPEGITLWLDVRCGGQGVALQGRSLQAADIVCAIDPDRSPFQAAQAFCHLMCSDPALPDHPVYGANNWYYAYGHSSREAILEDAAYLASLTQGLSNRPYMVIDDGWQAGRYHPDGTYETHYNGGPWLPNPLFGDMQTLADAISQNNVIPGIWVRLLQDHTAPDAWKLPGGGLDPSLPEVLHSIADTIHRIGQWGFRLFKHDFSTFDIFGRWGWEMPCEMAEDGWHFHNTSCTSAEIVRDLYHTIYTAACEAGMLVLGCNAIGHLGAGLMHMNRTGDDTSGLMRERTLRFGVNTLAFRMPQHRTFFDADADCIGISPLIPWEKNRQWGRLLSQSGTSLFVSVKPGSLCPETEAELREMYADASRPHPPAEPLDWLNTGLPQDWSLDGTPVTFHWYMPWGLDIGCGAGPAWDKVWKEVSAGLP